ncbi:MAG: S8 family serine peptidase [Bacteroidota bacterium]
MKKKLFLMKLGFSAWLFSVNVSFAQTKEERDEITSNYDKEKLSELYQQFKQEEEIQKKEVENWAKLHGEEIITTINGQGAQIIKISPEGNPIYRIQQNMVSAKTNRSNHLHSGGSTGFNLNGENMIAGLWDLGYARTTHQEFDGSGGNNRVTSEDGQINGVNSHHTHTVGTICASGVNANAKGIAPQAKVHDHDWGNDLSDATTEASNGLLVSNHSYGNGLSNLSDAVIGAYDSEARDWDNLMFNAPYYIACESAGNDGLDNSSNGSPLGGNSSYDKLNGRKTTKNGLSVANGFAANVNINGTFVSMNIGSYSSQGPTDELRIKPDITAYGGGDSNVVFSSNSTSDTAYTSLAGTSMASPSVVGCVLLLQQHYNKLKGAFMKSATVKGLILHTADDSGATGPDPRFGWGCINSKKAAETISADGITSVVKELTLQNNQTYSLTVNATGGPLYASISWTDRPGAVNIALNSSTTRLINDLDIRVLQNSTTNNPWKLTGVTTNGKGDNAVDPFERVDIDTASGNYTITVTHKGSLTGGNQNFSLIVTGAIDSALGIDDFSEMGHFLIYPNPVNEILNLDLSNLKSTAESVKIIDMQGKQSMFQKISVLSPLELPVSKLPKGTYFVQIKTEKGSVIKKFIKN